MPTDKGYAHSSVAWAVKKGVLPRLDGSIACADCSNPATEYDHRDYDRPLAVDPVCHSCNKKRGAGANGTVDSSPVRIREALYEEMKELAKREGRVTGETIECLAMDGFRQRGYTEKQIEEMRGHK